jgi:hypothetical protein
MGMGLGGELFVFFSLFPLSLIPFSFPFSLSSFCFFYLIARLFVCRLEKKKRIGDMMTMTM